MSATPEQAKRELTQNQREDEEMDKAINALIENGTVQYWTVLARMLTAKYLKQLVAAVNNFDHIKIHTD